MREVISGIRREEVLLGAGTRHPEWHFTSYYGWLRQAGFFCKGGNFYRIRERVASLVSLKDISDYVEGNLFAERDKAGRVRRMYADHLEMFNRYKTRYINENNLRLSLGEYKGEILRDDREHAYFVFLNGIVVVSRGGIELKRYEDVLVDDKIVYDSTIIKREVSITERYSAMTCDFADFCKKAINGEETGKGGGYDGINYLMRAMGYVLHTYKDPANAKMVFFSDCNNAEGIANGRTGKSLCAKVAIGHLRNLAIIDGKQFNTQDKYMLDNVDEDTEIVCLQDMKNGFNKETLYNMITGDFQVGKKYKSKTVIPFEKAPKMIADSNFSVNLYGSSDIDRFIVIGFGHFWSSKNSPLNYYRERFFDWRNKSSWDRFYSFMFYCVQDYMKNGVASYRLNELMAYSVFNKFDTELILEVKDILSIENNMFVIPNQSKVWFDNLSYFDNHARDLTEMSKTRLLTNLMYELGYKKLSKKVTIKNREGKDTKAYLSFFAPIGERVTLDGIRGMTAEALAEKSVQAKKLLG